MKLPHFVPCPNGTDRSNRARALRDLCSEVSRCRPHAATRANDEETDFSQAKFPASFTKGLLHGEFGLLERNDDYRAFVEAINSSDPNLFDSSVIGAKDYHLNPAGELDDTGKAALFKCEGPFKDQPETKKKDKLNGPPDWRGWESPRAGHVYELQGPDSDSVGMAPAPRVGSSELSAEVAELYGLALLRDVRFTDIAAGTSKEQFCGDGKSHALLSGGEVVDLLNCMSYFNGNGRVSSTPHEADSSGLNRFERNRRDARTLAGGNDPLNAPLTPQIAFRGSTRGAHVGPYLSQFMLIGSDSRCGKVGAGSGASSSYGLSDGLINYGTLVIDQRATTHKACLDYLTDWTSWLDAQNGADFRGADQCEPNRRFITTPRDLASYVHFDALYEAYLNAVFILDSMGVPFSRGFPEKSVSGRRTGFATFGGPHVLSLCTEVATRCLKAVRRQKFNFHRRARPEAMGGRIALVECGKKASLGCAAQAFETLRNDIPAALRDAVVEHNKIQNNAAMVTMRAIKCPNPHDPSKNFDQCNLLLPMAFPEGSPMHPAYGAGHATVAGGCITMIKAYFEMFEDCDSRIERPLCDMDGNPIAYVPTEDGSALTPAPGFSGLLTIQNELDKLAANIAIGRNMAGVHYYSDYYDSLRLGERVAVGILLEQAPTYGDAMEMTFNSFDGDFISISGQANAAPTLVVIDRHGNRVSQHDWWLRHVPGEQLIV